MKSILLCLLALVVPMTSLANQDNNCDNAVTSFEANACLSLESQKASQQLDQYYQASLERFKDDDILIASIKKSQQSWKEYLDSHCSAVWDMWRHGSIRNSKYTLCTTSLTKDRTYVLWNEYLTFSDSTPPILPEPLR